jgi:hypothetical protein
LGRSFPNLFNHKQQKWGSTKREERTEHRGKRQDERKANHIFVIGFKNILMVNCQKRMHSS